ncbi:MAG: hypothetical protein QOK48_3 [Blastocatellia bacterium]|jgi:hypothetical protein|nr:hypothetical protein [Blastocatellia bacterium]
MLNRQIKESDWKLFRRLHPVALERFCQRVIREINEVTSNCRADYHKRYLEVFALIMDRNEQMARSFDDMRRSTAIVLLTNIREAGLLTDEEFSEFSAETRTWVESILEIRRK